MKNTMASVPARGGTDALDDIDIDAGTARGQFVIEAEDEDEDLRGSRRHAQSMMESYGYTNSFITGRLAPAPKAGQQFDSKFRNQGFLNL